MVTPRELDTVQVSTLVRHAWNSAIFATKHVEKKPMIVKIS